MADDIDQAVMDHIVGLTTAAGTRVRPEFKAQNQKLPAITVTRVSEPTEENLDGATGLREGRWQVDCWAANYAASLALASEVNAGLDGFSGLMGTASPRFTVQRARKENEADLSRIDGDLRMRRRSLDFVITYEG